MKYLIFDTETTGLPKDYNAPISDTDNWPRVIQIAWQLHDEWGQIIEHKDHLVYPDGFDIPFESEQIHGISTALAKKEGISLKEMLGDFQRVLNQTDFIVGQNITFDTHVMGSEFYRLQIENNLQELPILDTCTEITAELLQLPGGRGGKFKLPNLTELHTYLFGKPFNEAHNATADVEATTRCFFELLRTTDVFNPEELKTTPEYLVEFKNHNPKEIQPVGLTHINLKNASDKLKTKTEPKLSKTEIDENLKALEDAPFVHLHNHTQFSILQATTTLSDLVSKTTELGMPAVAITDAGNMMGAFHFVKEINSYNSSLEKQKLQAEEKGETWTKKPLIPIVGAELYVCENHKDKSNKDNGYQVVFLAKNKKGYHNLAKMSSIAYIDGFYYVPRIDKEIVEKYKEDIIVLTGNLNGEISSKILNLGEKQAEDALLWWKEQFGDDLYIEIMHHNQDDEDRANQTLLKFSQKHNIKIVATNNTFYLNKNDAEAHDILLCVKDGEKKNTPIGRGRGYRFGFPNNEYYYKSPEQMKTLFKDLPEAILNLGEIINKIEPYKLERKILLPKFDIPEEFKHPEDEIDGGKRGENAFLKHLAFEGAQKKYPTLTNEIKERIDFELSVIEKTGYPGYFLIVEDFCRAARKMGVSVGPGRGSAAGSAVAYCLGITNIDPIKYDLLFERFLNPDRVSMPDIDIDFDDSGRQKVIEYVIGKYGANQVSQIITYGTMAAKSAIRDTARVLDLDLRDADRLAKLVPDMKLKKMFAMNAKDLEAKLGSELYEQAKELISISEGNGNNLEVETINQAKIIEGSLRNTGIHACGVIITPDDITNFVPVTKAKESDGFVTQFDNSVAESAGLLKMDFLGLKTLTLIKDSLKLIKRRFNVDINIDEIPIDDEETYKLFQRGDTVGIFQYESPGMQKYLRELQPSVFADLIAMNALYRPGPIEYIPSFIKRKHGVEPITYDFDACEEYLNETYGITVYQEQVMLLSQKLAGFTKGEADVLRKAMGKKQIETLAKMKPKFVSQAAEKGFEPNTLEKIWKDWEAFASYAFNKSHSTCYAWVAYQTAYLKAHYPSEYMAAVLSNNMNNLKDVTFFMEECHRMGIEVLSPDVNESDFEFTVNDKGNIRFGMGAVKGVGQGAVDTIVEERNKNGRFKNVFDFVERADLRQTNKRVLENLALAGAFDDLDNYNRAQYFVTDNGISSIEKLVRYAQAFQESKNSNQNSLFGDLSEVSGFQIQKPEIPEIEEWSLMHKLGKEKEVTGIYISSHPMDNYKYELKILHPTAISDLVENKQNYVDKEITIAGMINSFEHKDIDGGRSRIAIFELEDQTGSIQLRLKKNNYLEYQKYMMKELFVMIKLKVGMIKENGFIYFNILKIEELSKYIEIHSKKITLNLKLSQINEENINRLLNLCSRYSGNKDIVFNIFDENDKELKLSKTSLNKKINICKELLEDLNDKLFLDFKLN